MSNYGYNFGFRRSDESMRSGTEGRLKVPATGTFLIGDLVEFDAANPGFIKKSAAAAPIEAGFRGLLIQEDAWDVGVHGNQYLTTVDKDVVRNGRLCAIWTGSGLKVWLKNTPALTKPGQRARTGRTIVTAVGLAIGDFLAWDGAKYIKAIDATTAVGRVTLTNGVDYVEAVILK